jgi:glyoxylase-like metal-dependent hydrolase (beta-lactamase superfamily II)
MKLVGVVAAALTAAASLASPASAQVKLWQVTSGTFTFDKGLLTASKDVGKVMNFPIAMYIIEHPRGLVVFDTGNSAKIAGDGCAAYWGEGYCKGYSPKMAREDAIDKQIEKTGHKLSDVKYVIYSHFHLDHAGNLEMFKDAINVVQKNEIQFAWWPEKFSAANYVLKDYEKTRDYKFLELTGDFDLFGDGSIVVVSSPGHTKGHQSVKVKLAKTGTLVLTADAIYTSDNAAGIPPGIAPYSPSDYFASLAKLKALADGSGGQLWFSHDPVQYGEHQHDKPYD